MLVNAKNTNAFQSEQWLWTEVAKPHLFASMYCMLLFLFLKLSKLYLIFPIIQFNSIPFYLYSAFNKGALSQSCFTENRPLMSKPRATVARKNSLVSRCVFGVGFSLVGYVYSRGLVCFEPHYLLVVCTRVPLLGQCVFYFDITPPVSTPTLFDCFRVYAVSMSASFHLI